VGAYVSYAVTVQQHLTVGVDNLYMSVVNY